MDQGGPGWIRVDQEDQGDHNPLWWTSTGIYILLMSSYHESPGTINTLLIKNIGILITNSYYCSNYLYPDTFYRRKKDH